MEVKARGPLRLALPEELKEASCGLGPVVHAGRASACRILRAMEGHGAWRTSKGMS